MPTDFIFLGFGLIFLWLFLLSVFLWRAFSHYNKITQGVSQRSLKSVLETLLKESNITKKDIEFLKTQCAKIEKEGNLHIQKIGLVRFNPFKDTGGEQSFVLSLIDGRDTGVVLSGLFSRSGTRWYAKKVMDGKGTEYELTDEEKKAIREARTS